MAYLARGIAQTSELVKEFNQLAPVVIPGVVKWRYTFESDWSGDPAIFLGDRDRRGEQTAEAWAGEGCLHR